MHTLSCFFLLHHHFQAVDDSFDIVSLSSNSVNDDSTSMSDYSEENYDEQIDETNVEVTTIPTDDVDESNGTTINPDDEENQFIFDENSQTLICIGTTFNEIPQSIIDKFATKTKVLDLSHNRFRSLASLAYFTELEELFLDDNDLDDLHTRFPNLPNLKTLMVNKNRLQDLYKLVDHLRNAFPSLEYLSLLGNEACPYQIIAADQPLSSNNDANIFRQHRVEEEYERYRHFLIFRLPTLRFLDAKEISSNERMTANKLGDILNSIAETKLSSGIRDADRNENKQMNYTPLPADTGSKGHRISIGKAHRTYHGQNSEGNKFITNPSL